MRNDPQARHKAAVRAFGRKVQTARGTMSRTEAVDAASAMSGAILDESWLQRIEDGRRSRLSPWEVRSLCCTVGLEFGSELRRLGWSGT